MEREIFETQTTIDEKARLLLEWIYTLEEIERILRTPGQAALLIDFVSRVVRAWVHSPSSEEVLNKGETVLPNPPALAPMESPVWEEIVIPSPEIIEEPPIPTDSDNMPTNSNIMGMYFWRATPRIQELQPTRKITPPETKKITPSPATKDKTDGRTVRRWPSFQASDMTQLISILDQLLGEVFTTIGKKDSHIQERWGKFGELGTFSWDQGTPNGIPTISIRFNEEQKSARADAIKTWARLTTKAFKEQLSKHKWIFRENGEWNLETYWKHYQFKYGNFQVKFYLPFTNEGLNDKPKNERIGVAWWDLPKNLDEQMGVPAIKNIEWILSRYLQGIYNENNRIYRANQSFEIGQRSGNTNLKKEEFVFNTGGNIGYDIERNIRGKVITIYQPTSISRETEKLNQVTEFLKKKTLLEQYFESNGFKKIEDNEWENTDGIKYIFRQNGASPILEFHIDGWKIEIHTSKREHDYGIEKKD